MVQSYNCLREQFDHHDFKNVGFICGPFDLGLIPIDAYQRRPRGISPSIDPSEAVDIFINSQCKRALAMHWGASFLAEDVAFKVPMMFKEALKANKLPETGVFDTCRIAEKMAF